MTTMWTNRGIMGPWCTSRERPQSFSRARRTVGKELLMGSFVPVLIFLAVVVIFAFIVVAKSFALVPQAEAAVIERLGRYNKTVSGQLTFLLPFLDRIRARVDLRGRVVSFPPQ